MVKPHARQLLHMLAMVLLGLSLVQALVSFSPQVYWDIDPRSSAAAVPLTMLGPWATVTLNLVSITVASLILITHAWVGGRIAWWVVTLTSIGMFTCMRQCWFDALSLQKGITWLAAAHAALAFYLASQHTHIRRWLFAGLIALVIPLTLRSVFYVTVEHPQTVQEYLRNESQIIEARGWKEGSPQHQMYRRRLMQTEATGAFGLSNVFGSLMASLSGLALGSAVGGVIGSRARTLTSVQGEDNSRTMYDARQSWVIWVIAAAGLLTTILSFSKGALAALVAGMLILMVSLWRPKWAFPVIWLLIITASIAILIRGAMGPPPTVEGERSLLFRYHYLQAGHAILMDQIRTGMVWGLPAGEFQDLYSRYKNPLNPEEVISTHSMFMDWLIMLGIGGVAWLGLMLIWSTHAYRSLMVSVPQEPSVVHDPDQPVLTAREQLRIVFLLTVGVFGFQLWWHRSMMLPETAILWMIGAAAFAWFMLKLVRTPALSTHNMCVGLMVGAAILLIHNQIEMSFYHQGSANLSWMILAVAAGGAHLTPRLMAFSLTHIYQLMLVTIGSLMLIAMSVWLAWPIYPQQQALLSAAIAYRAGDFQATHSHLFQAHQAIPEDEEALVNLVDVSLQEMANYAGNGSPQTNHSSQMFEVENILFSIPDDKASLRLLRARLLWSQWMHKSTGDLRHLRKAALTGELILQRSPYSLPDAMRLARVLTGLGEYDDAKRHYQLALRLHQQAYLDPMRQLSDTELWEAKQRTD